jgi:import inner membrane translocase subunit TIM22
MKNSILTRHTDANGYGILSRQNRHGRCNGRWPRSHVRSIHGFRKPPPTPMPILYTNTYAKMRYDTPMSHPLPVNAAPPAGAPKGPTTSAVASATANAKPSIPTVSSVVNAAATPTAGPSVALNPAGGAAAVPLTDLPMRQQLKAGLRDMYQSSKSSGKNFAKVGAIFSGTECAIEGLRAKNDLYNGVAGGCLTGGILARNAGPQAVVVGCAGFAVFSAAIDAYMRMPEDERSRPIA